MNNIVKLSLWSFGCTCASITLGSVLYKDFLELIIVNEFASMVLSYIFISLLSFFLILKLFYKDRYSETLKYKIALIAKLFVWTIFSYFYVFFIIQASYASAFYTSSGAEIPIVIFSILALSAPHLGLFFTTKEKEITYEEHYANH